MNRQLYKLLDQDKIDRLEKWIISTYKDSCPFDSTGCRICVIMFKRFEKYKDEIERGDCPLRESIWTKEDRKVQAEIMKDEPRDSKGRWISYDKK